MKVSEFCKDRGDVTRLARKADVAYSTIWILARDPDATLDSYKTAKAIADATGGEVSVLDILESGME